MYPEIILRYNIKMHHKEWDLSILMCLDWDRNQWLVLVYIKWISVVH
jgi:hypothetical protein